MTVTAVFEAIPPEQYTLTMSVNEAGWGTIAPSSGTHTYDEDTVVTIAATAAEGYRFTGWTGDVADESSASTTVTTDERHDSDSDLRGDPAGTVHPDDGGERSGLGHNRAVLRHPHL